MPFRSNYSTGLRSNPDRVKRTDAGCRCERKSKLSRKAYALAGRLLGVVVFLPKRRIDGDLYGVCLDGSNAESL